MSAAYTVEKFLNMHHVPYEMVSHPHTVTSLRTAKAANIDAECMAKAVLLEDDMGYMIAVLPATHHVKLGKLRQELGRDLRMATESEIPGVFKDCALGAIPPVGEAYGVETVVDDSLMEQPELYFEAGDHEHLMHVKTKDFIDMLKNAHHMRFSSHI